MHPKNLLANLNLANQLTFLRLVAIPFFILSVLRGRFDLALALFAGATITDLLDGLTARWFHQGTPLGAYLDPAADKLLLTTAFVLLTDYRAMFQSIPMVERIPLWLTILTISRDVLIVAVALVLYLARGQTRFGPSWWGKWTTAAEMATVVVFLAHNAAGRRSSLPGILVWATLALTLISGFHYLLQTIRGLRDDDPDTATH